MVDQQTSTSLGSLESSSWCYSIVLRVGELFHLLYLLHIGGSNLSAILLASFSFPFFSFFLYFFFLSSSSIPSPPPPPLPCAFPETLPYFVLRFAGPMAVLPGL